MAKPTTTAIRKHQKFTDNPFAKGLYAMKRGRKTVAIASKSYGLFDRQTGEVEDTTKAHGFIGVQRIVDKEEFVKIFIAGLARYMELSQLGQQILGYFFHATKIGDDKVYFDIHECVKFTGKSTVSCSRGLTELLDKEFVARSNQINIYFINVNLFFKGDRYTLFDDVILKGSRTAQIMEKKQQIDIENTRQFEMFSEEKNAGEKEEI